MNSLKSYTYIQSHYPQYKTFFRVPEKLSELIDIYGGSFGNFYFEISSKNKKRQLYEKCGYKYFISISNSLDIKNEDQRIHLLPHGYIFYLENNTDFLDKIDNFIGKINLPCLILFSFEKLDDSMVEKYRPLFWELRKKAKNKQLEVDDNFVRVQSAKRNIFMLGPREINLDISEYCNAQCIFCYTNGSIYKTPKQNKIYKLTKEDLRFLSLIGVEGISLGITGEPFLNKSSIIELFNDICGVPISISFLSNGYNLIEYVKYIYKSDHVKEFIINIGAGDPKNFLLSRPKDSINNFYKAWKGIILLKKIRPDISLILKYVVTNQNKNGLKNFVEKALRHGIEKIDIVPVTTYDFSRDLKLSEQDKSDIFSYIEKIKINFPKGCINHFGSGIEQIKNKGKCYEHLFYNGFYEGNIYGCCRFVFKIGSLKEDISNSYHKTFMDKYIWEESQNVEKIQSLEKCSRCTQYEESAILNTCLNIEKYV